MTMSFRMRRNRYIYKSPLKALITLSVIIMNIGEDGSGWGFIKWLIMIMFNAVVGGTHTNTKCPKAPPSGVQLWWWSKKILLQICGDCGMTGALHSPQLWIFSKVIFNRMLIVNFLWIITFYLFCWTLGSDPTCA